MSIRASGETLLDRLVDLLDLERLEHDLFRGRQPAEPVQRVFGGQVAAQALVAAGRTVDADRPVHSLHAYFLGPGNPDLPIVFAVDRIRDGRCFTTRRVVARQNGQAIFNLAASFHLPEDGPLHAPSMPTVPTPAGLRALPDALERYAGELGGVFTRPRPFDVRYVEDPPRAAADKEARRSTSDVWMRADGQLSDDPLLHVCALTFASDMTLLDSVLLPHGLAYGLGGLTMASLDHAMWFHAPFRADEWLLYSQEVSWTGAGRGLVRGNIFTREGQLVASVVQEGLIRTSGIARRGPPTPPVAANEPEAVVRPDGGVHVLAGARTPASIGSPQARTFPHTFTRPLIL